MKQQLLNIYLKSLEYLLAEKKKKTYTAIEEASLAVLEEEAVAREEAAVEKKAKEEEAKEELSLSETEVKAIAKEETAVSKGRRKKSAWI